MVRQILCVFILFLVTPFCVEGEKPKIRVFHTEFQGSVIPVHWIILKEFEGQKSFYFNEWLGAGRWEENGDSVFLNLEYRITKENMIPLDTMVESPFWINRPQYIFRNDTLVDCSKYVPMEDYDVFNGDTIFYPYIEGAIITFDYFIELKFHEKPLNNSRNVPLSYANIFYPDKSMDVLLLIRSSPRYFEYYFSERRESLIGSAKLKSNTIILYPLYIQRFDQDGEMVFEKAKNIKKIKLKSKGYVLKLTGKTKYPVSKKYTLSPVVRTVN